MSSVWLTRACALRKIWHRCSDAVKDENCVTPCHTVDRKRFLIIFNAVAFVAVRKHRAELSTCGQRLISLLASKCVCDNTSVSIIYVCVCMHDLFDICVHISSVCQRQLVCVCNLSLCVWPWPTCGRRSAVLSEKLIGPPSSGAEIVQLTLSKAKEQPCFLEAASPLKFYWFLTTKGLLMRSRMWGVIWEAEQSTRGGGRQSGCKEKGEYQGEGLYSWASVSLVYTCSNYAVRIFRAFWVFFWKLHCLYVLVSTATTLQGNQLRTCWKTKVYAEFEERPCEKVHRYPYLYWVQQTAALLLLLASGRVPKGGSLSQDPSRHSIDVVCREQTNKVTIYPNYDGKKIWSDVDYEIYVKNVDPGGL